MKQWIGGVCILVFAAVLVIGNGLTRPRAAQSVAEPSCGAASALQVRTTLYFGMTRPTGTVSELDWQLFLRDEVTTRFPRA